MATRTRKIASPNAAAPARQGTGLMRTVRIGTQPARTLRNLFANLRDVERVEVIAADSERRVDAARVRIDRTEGHGSTELYRLDSDLYVKAIDTVFDDAREEFVPGEELVEVHICLRGAFTMRYPGEPQAVVVKGPCLLLQYLRTGVDITERVDAGVRVTGVSVYVRYEHLARLMERNGIVDAGLFTGADVETPGRAWYRKLPLDSALNYAAGSLLDSPYRNGVRLLHAESKALEILCQVLSTPMGPDAADVPKSVSAEIRQLDEARRILCSSLNSVPRIADVARAVGMSPSKLKRKFHARFGKTVFECSLDARMRKALELLQTREMTVCQVAYAVGYRHQTSFNGAFRRHFGIPPRAARQRD